MNKSILFGSGLFALLLMVSVISTGICVEMHAQSVLNKDGLLSHLFALQENNAGQNKPTTNNAGNNAGGSSKTETTPNDEPTETVMPEMNPSADSPDAPVRSNPSGAADSQSNINGTDDQKQSVIEQQPVQSSNARGSDNSSGSSSRTEQSSTAEPSKQQQKPELSPALAGLRDKVRRTLAVYQKMPFNNRQHTADEIIEFCQALGCSTEITLFEGSNQRRANGITCLCWNYPCGGYEPLMMVKGHISARLGYGTQSRPSEFLATLAMARVPSTYPMRVGDNVRSVADLVESEKISCRAGADMSLKLIGLAFYAEQATWQNDRGEEWSVDKIVREQLARPMVTTSGAGLERLLGLSYVLYRREKQNLPIDGQYAQARQNVDEFQNFAFGIQNSDGSWGNYLSGRVANRDASAVLRSSGQVLEWLTISMPQEKLADQSLASGIGYLISTLNSQRYLYNLPTLSTQEIAGAMRGLHALAIYDERMFKPFDPEQATPENTPENATAKKDSAGASR